MIVGVIVAGGLILTAVIAAASALRAADRRRGARPFTLTARQYGRYYSRRTFFRLAGTAAAAALLAHAGVDEAVDRAYAARVRGPGADAAAAVWKGFGERFWFGVWGAFALLDGLLVSTPLLRWGRGNFEAMIVGLPMLWTLQRLGGASRPSEDRGARWRPLADDNTASGHTFIAAVPLLNARTILGDRVARGLLWLASWGTGWSRLHDRKHYLSQVVFGHAIAETAVAAVRDD